MIGRRQIPYRHVAVVIDAFRAFATASYVLECQPASYMIATQSSVISKLASTLVDPVLIGKPEKGIGLLYDIPNSPTRVQGINITGRHILHRTEAGAKGILLASDADFVLAAGFVNADATVKYIQTLSNPKVTLHPMGHEATSPSLEDDICAQYIQDLLDNKKGNLNQFLPALRNGPGQYFFSRDQWQYPREDFERCLKLRRFNFAIQATIHNDYATLSACK